MSHIFGKIYLLTCNITNIQYIGSNTVNITRRYIEHKSKYRQYLFGKYHYVSSFKIVANNDSTILQIDERYCETKRELLDLEG